MTDVHQRAFAIAESQRGLITRRQATVCGMTASAIEHVVRRDSWCRMGTGLYVLRGVTATWELHVLGAVLVAGPPAWASHATSVRLFGGTHVADDLIEITVPLERRIRIRGVRVHRSGTLHEHDLRDVDGIPTLSMARTILDLSNRLGTRALESTVDDALRRRVMTLAELHGVAARLSTIAPGRSPATVATILRDRTPGHGPGDSELETSVLEMLRNAGLPIPERQHRVVVGTRTYFLDLAYPEQRIAIEVDGFAFHHDRTTFDRDRHRQNDLVNAGWTVLRFTSRSTPAEVVDTVRRALFGRSCTPGAARSTKHA
jgi:very-short-patch-repair endonuclease